MKGKWYCKLSSTRDKTICQHHLSKRKSTYLSRLLQPSTIVLMKISQKWMRLTDNFAQFRGWYNAGKARDFLSASRKRGGCNKDGRTKTATITKFTRPGQSTVDWHPVGGERSRGSAL